MTTTEQLAQALRDIAEHRMSMYGNDDFFHLKKIARTALAVYELEKAKSDGGVDCTGLARKLESRAKLVKFQTTEQAMRAARRFRLLAGGAAPAAPVAADTAPAGYMNAGQLFELRQGRLPWAYLYREKGVGSSVPVFTGEAPAAAPASASEAPVAAPQGEPVAARYDFDGYGYLYIDNGHGSDWETRIPDAEMLYTKSDEAEIRADERERCARLCEFEASNCSSPKLGKLLTNDGRQIKKAQGVGALNCANAIRSMGKERGQG